MNILHVAPSVDPRFGGPSHALVGFVRAAEAVGCRATIAAPGSAGDGTTWIGSHLPGVDIHLTGGSGRLWETVGPLAARADVVHVHGTLNLASSVGMWRTIRANRPVIVRPFGTLSRYTFGRRRRALKRAYHALLDAPALRRAAAIHFTTDSERDDALRWEAIRADRCFVIPPPWTASGLPVDHARRSASSGATVVYLSRLDPKKGLETLLDAWPAVTRAHQAARLVIAGDGAPEYRRALENRVARLGLTDTVQFLGFVAGEAKRRLLAEADIFTLPSRHENFGIAVIEAIAAGLPAIVSSGVGLASWVRDKGLGLVVPEDDPASLAEGLARALRDQSLRARCAHDGPLAVSNSFGPAVVGPALHHMYASAINGGPRL